MWSKSNTALSSKLKAKAKASIPEISIMPYNHIASKYLLKTKNRERSGEMNLMMYLW